MLAHAIRNGLAASTALVAVGFYTVLVGTVFAAAPPDPQPLDAQLQPSGLVGVTADQAEIETAVDPIATLMKLINWLLSLVAILATIAIVWGGIMYILALGNENRASLAKRIIGYAILGLVIVILSYAIISTARAFL